MQFSIKAVRPGLRAFLSALVIAAAALPIASADHAASAESAYIDQAPGGMTKPLTLASAPGPQSTGFKRFGSQISLMPPPEQLVPHGSNGFNFAQSVMVGNYNTVAQIQAGRNDISAVSVLGGNRNNVGVLQGGNDRSNVVMLGTQGMNIAVLQPANSLPVNMLIARLPNGSILIKR